MLEEGSGSGMTGSSGVTGGLSREEAEARTADLTCLVSCYPPSLGRDRSSVTMVSDYI